MKYTYVSLTITTYRRYNHEEFDCYFYTQVNDTTNYYYNITLEEANLLMWKMKKLGASVENRYNPYTPRVFSRHFVIVNFEKDILPLLK